MNIGRKLATLRKSSNLNQDDLANQLHISRQTISNWENDKTYPDIASLVMISNFFDLSLDNLIKEDVPLMKNKILQNRLRWVGIGSIFLILATYLCLLLLKYSLSLGSLLVGGCTVLGLVLIFTFIQTTKKANLRTFKSVINYLNDEPNKSTSHSKKNTIFQYIIGSIIGILIGSLLTWLIFKFALGINLF